MITTQSGRDERLRFLAALSKEIFHAGKRYGRLRFDTLYFGGGTPSLLSSSELGEILAVLNNVFKFNPGFEFTLEANPEDLTEEKVRSYREAGINRISLGVQAFQDDLLRDMNRSHGAAEVEQSLRLLRNAGFDNINLDLICRLPNQTNLIFQESVKRAIESNPEQVTLYDLQVHPQTVYGKRDLILPDEDRHFEMVEFADKAFDEAGLKNYALGCYAKPGREAKHNMIYWHNEEYLGLGPGAFSYMKGIRSQFAETVRTYLAKCESADWQADTEDILTQRQKEIETLMTGLRLREGVDLNRLGGVGTELRRSCADLVEDKVLTISDNCVALTQKGQFLVENIFEEIISRFGGSTN